jgi:hypothetical protein
VSGFVGRTSQDSDRESLIADGGGALRGAYCLSRSRLGDATVGQGHEVCPQCVRTVLAMRLLWPARQARSTPRERTRLQLFVPDAPGQIPARHPSRVEAQQGRGGDGGRPVADPSLVSSAKAWRSFQFGAACLPVRTAHKNSCIAKRAHSSSSDARARGRVASHALCGVRRSPDSQLSRGRGVRGARSAGESWVVGKAQAGEPRRTIDTGSWGNGRRADHDHDPVANR